LIHMNARLYDPEIGRFIQADDFVEPDATQGLNRYSYVLNNPLSATDPSGNFSLRQALGVVVGVVASILSFGAATPFVSFLWAVGGGFASAAIATGSLKAGLWGAVSAAVFFGIGSAFQVDKFAAGAKAGADGTIAAVKSGLTGGQTLAKIAAHATAGGTLTALQGGKFGHGFVAAGFTEALSPAVGQIDGKDFGSVLSRTAISAAIGGTASSLSGGSFANGAQTGAFQQLFNESVHEAMMRGPNVEDGTGADLNYFNPDQDPVLYSAAANFPDRKGYFFVDSHADSTTATIADTRVQTYGNSPRLDAERLHAAITQSPRYHKGDIVILLGCNTASNGLAGRLANVFSRSQNPTTVIGSVGRVVRSVNKDSYYTQARPGSAWTIKQRSTQYFMDHNRKLMGWRTYGPK